MRVFSPSEIEALIGISPDRLRDWRRRGFLADCGVLPLPNGAGWTLDPNDPRLNGKDKWFYGPKEALRLYLSKELQNLGLLLKPTFSMASKLSDVVYAWIRAEAGVGPTPDIRYLITYPIIGENTSDPFIPLYGAGMDLQMVEFTACPATILLDCQILARHAPKELHAAIAE